VACFRPCPLACFIIFLVLHSPRSFPQAPVCHRSAKEQKASQRLHHLCATSLSFPFRLSYQAQSSSRRVLCSLFIILILARLLGLADCPFVCSAVLSFAGPATRHLPIQKSHFTAHNPRSPLTSTIHRFLSSCVWRVQQLSIIQLTVAPRCAAFETSLLLPWLGSLTLYVSTFHSHISFFCHKCP
jgi:hypothetical protein